MCWQEHPHKTRCKMIYQIGCQNPHEIASYIKGTANALCVTGSVVVEGSSVEFDQTVYDMMASLGEDSDGYIEADPNGGVMWLDGADYQIGMVL